MIANLEVIDRIPQELAWRIEADEYFSDIPVVVFERGNFASELARKQAVITAKSGKRGVAVIVLQCIADDEDPEVLFGPMKLRPALQVVENVELNNDTSGTGKSARKVARKLIDVVKSLRLVGLTTDFTPDRPAIEPVPLAKDLGASIIAYQVNFVTWEADAEPQAQVAMPLFAINPDNDSTLIITCATEGAQVWYTTDDTYPAPTGSVPESQAQLYGSPIAVPEQGFNIRAAAYLPGAVASQVNRAAVSTTAVTTQQ